MIMNLIRGFCMALADSVPGVSGGTVAFLLGFYDKFISSIDDLISGNMQKKKEALIFLMKLGIGWVIGFVSAVSVLASIFDTKIYEISSLFMGFILFAIPLVIKEEKKSMIFKPSTIAAGIAGVAIVALITYFNPMSGQGTSINLSVLNIGLIIYVFIAAMFAISAMVLPGISGSTLLLIFGLYVPIISAVKSVITFDFAYLPILIVFALGILTGAASVVRIIKWALDKHRPIMIFLIIGMMIGSFYAIMQGPTTLEIPKAAMNLANFQILPCLMGVALVAGMQMIKERSERNGN